MAFDWYRTDSAFFRHPKVFELNRALNQERSGWYVHGLWSWLVTYARRGQFRRPAKACGAKKATCPICLRRRMPPRIRRGAPVFGEHTAQVLGSLGYSAEDVGALQAAGVAYDPALPKPAGGTDV